MEMQYDLSLPLTGKRVGTESRRARRYHYDSYPLTDEDKKILECIPLYPQVITPQEINLLTNIPEITILSKLKVRLSLRFPLLNTSRGWCSIAAIQYNEVDQ